MSRLDKLVEIVETYQTLATENYDRIRGLAEQIRGGLCDYIGMGEMTCVYLVPPTGPFEPKAHGDKAFSMPPRGFRPLAPVSFGLAVRLTRGNDWLRVSMECRKVGEVFKVQIEDGAEYEFSLPLSFETQLPFYDHIYSHILNWFSDQIERYKEGEYASRVIGFDFADDTNLQEV
ncbi:MAG: hypothetical protein KDA53_07090 [Hyphomonas sp.]|nr:hypothetical protein [Hyphomonas sp.]